MRVTTMDVYKEPEKCSGSLLGLGCEWEQRGLFSLHSNMVVVVETHRPTFASSKLTEGLEYNALKHDQVLGLLQVSLRSRGQAGYSQGLMHSYHSLSQVPC